MDRELSLGLMVEKMSENGKMAKNGILKNTIKKVKELEFGLKEKEKFNQN